MNSSKFTILDDEKLRYCEIYKITCTVNDKHYIGQAVSHILNHKRYRPYGMEGRFKCHISEAFSQKKCQSKYLNNAIKKYGSDNFVVSLVEECDLSSSDEKERYYINKYNTMFPNGYNLNSGGKNFVPTRESKKRVSEGVVSYYKQKKLERFKYLKTISEELKDNIRPLKREGKHFGWYVIIDKKKVDFGGVHIELEDSKKMCLNFLKELQKQVEAKHLDAGSA